MIPFPPPDPSKRVLPTAPARQRQRPSYRRSKQVVAVGAVAAAGAIAGWVALDAAGTGSATTPATTSTRTATPGAVSDDQEQEQQQAGQAPVGGATPAVPGHRPATSSHGS
jgi:hypothetical protein